MKKDLNEHNCGYDRCPFVVGFWLRETGEDTFHATQKLLRDTYRSGARMLEKYAPKKARVKF